MSNHSGSVRTVRDLYTEADLDYPTAPHRHYRPTTVDWVELWRVMSGAALIVRSGRVDPDLPDPSGAPRKTTTDD